MLCREFVVMVAVLLASGPLRAASSDISDVAGIHKITLLAGPNFFSAPLHRARSFQGVIDTVATGSITLSDNPGWTANQFGPSDGFSQYAAILRKDASATPGNVGDWWPVAGNTADTLSLNTGGEDLTAILAGGDEIELRRLVSLKDLFGSGASLRLNTDSDGSASAQDEDVIYFVNGTSFSSEIFYHNGAIVDEGFYVDGNGPLDGSTITLAPDEPIMLFRKTGSPALNLLSAGHVQAFPLTHYLQPGPNPVATGFPLDVPIGTSGLVQAGWKADVDGSASVQDEDLLYTVQGTSFADEVFLHDGSLAPPGWYANGSADEYFPLDSAQGFVIFVQNSAGLRWRQPAPF